MRILLIDPPGKNKGLNTGLAFLSAVLKDEHEVYVLDLNNLEMGSCGEPNPEMPIADLEVSLKQAVKEFNPHMVGVSVKTFSTQTSKHIFASIRPQNPNLITVVGGPHITLDGHNFIKENKIDFGIQGEGEKIFPELCRALEKKENYAGIQGLYYWENGQLLNNPQTDTIQNLDALPFPYYGNFSSVIANKGRLREYPLLSSRGCPYSCSYCSMPKIMGNRWRPHGTDRVINELEHAKKEYGSKSFTVVDDNFTLNLKRVEKICDTLVDKKLDLSWNSQNGIRADRITEHIAKKMRRSGCRYVWIGVESSDEEVFAAINKGEKLDDIKEGIKHLKKAGIGVGGFFIIGLPFATRESDLKAIDFVKEQGIDGWWFNFVPYPNTQALDWVNAHGRYLRSSDGALQFGTNSIDPVFDTAEYSKESRIKTYNEIHIKLGLFDRLADSSLKQSDKWRRVITDVRPYGMVTVFSLLIFIIKYNAKIAFHKILK